MSHYTQQLYISISKGDINNHKSKENKKGNIIIVEDW